MKTTLSDLLTLRGTLRTSIATYRRELEQLEAQLDQASRDIATLVEEQRHSLSFAALDLGKLPVLPYSYHEWDSSCVYALPYFIQQKLRARDQEKLVRVEATEEGFALTFGVLSTRAERASGEFGKEEVLRIFTFLELETLLCEAKEWEEKLSSRSTSSGSGEKKTTSRAPRLTEAQQALLANLEL